ncbi:nucleotidyltransferase [Ketobacter sp.]
MKDFHTTPITELAGIIAEHLQKHGIEVVLVGGLAVEVYTENLYLTKDIDMVNTNYRPPKHVHAAMAELGFFKQGRVYVNTTTDITVEFPTAPLSVGDELIKSTTHLHVADRRIPILKVEDVVKDRLAAYIHWQDRQSLIQATAVIIKHQLQPDAFKQFCLREGSQQHYQMLEQLHQEASNKQINSMEELETVLTQILIKQI